MAESAICSGVNSNLLEGRVAESRQFFDNHRTNAVDLGQIVSLVFGRSLLGGTADVFKNL